MAVLQMWKLRPGDGQDLNAGSWAGEAMLRIVL